MSARPRAAAVVASAAVAAASLAAAAASEVHARSERMAVIRPGLSIGKVRLGTTEAEVRRALGRPQVVVRRRGVFGLRTIEYQYGYGSYTVRFAGRAGRYRVVRIGTTLVRERTPAGLGVGTPESRLIRRTPGLRCEPLQTDQFGSVRLVRSTSRDCTVAAGGGRRTIFTTGVDTRYIWDPVQASQWIRRARVIEVSVASP